MAAISTEAEPQSTPMTESTDIPEDIVTDDSRHQAMVETNIPTLHPGGTTDNPSHVSSAAPNLSLQPLATINRAGVGTQQGLAGFTPISTDLSGQDVDQPEDSMEDLNLGSLDQQGLEWWDLTFAEAGFAHFEGLEPVNGFRGM